MPTTASDRHILTVCAVAVVVGVVLMAVGFWLDPVRVARHWWRNR